METVLMIAGGWGVLDVAFVAAAAGRRRWQASGPKRGVRPHLVLVPGIRSDAPAGGGYGLGDPS